MNIKSIIQIISLSTLITLSFSNCKQQITPVTKVEASAISEIDSQVVVKKYQDDKIRIDSLYKISHFISTYVKMNDDKVIYQIKDNKWPESNIELYYNVLKNKEGKVLLISEHPYSESGDWEASMDHYFNDNGNTFAVSRHSNTFGSGCTDGVAYETKTDYYDENFKIIKSEYLIVDEKNKPLNKIKCDGLGLMENSKAFSNYTGVLKAKGLLNAENYKSQKEEEIYECDFFVINDSNGPQKFNEQVVLTFENTKSGAQLNIKIPKYKSTIDYYLKYLKTEEDEESITKWYKVIGENANQFEFFKLTQYKTLLETNGSSYQYNLVLSNYFGEKFPTNESAFLSNLKD